MRHGNSCQKTKADKMKAFILGLIVSCGAFAQYEPGTLEALGYLNDQWVEKPRQRAHERDLMRIRSQGQGFNQSAPAGLYEPLCHVRPVIGLDGSIVGYRRECY